MDIEELKRKRIEERRRKNEEILRTLRKEPPKLKVRGYNASENREKTAKILPFARRDAEAIRAELRNLERAHALPPVPETASNTTNDDGAGLDEQRGGDCGSGIMPGGDLA